MKLLGQASVKFGFIVGYDVWNLKNVSFDEFRDSLMLKQLSL
jgi:hypothetical protein